MIVCPICEFVRHSYVVARRVANDAKDLDVHMKLGHKLSRRRRKRHILSQPFGLNWLACPVCDPGGKRWKDGEMLAAHLRDAHKVALSSVDIYGVYDQGDLDVLVTLGLMKHNGHEVEEGPHDGMPF
jgi:hypothetical protein